MFTSTKSGKFGDEIRRSSGIGDLWR